MHDDYQFCDDSNGIKMAGTINNDADFWRSWNAMGGHDDKLSLAALRPSQSQAGHQGQVLLGPASDRLLLPWALFAPTATQLYGFPSIKPLISVIAGLSVPGELLVTSRLL